MAKDKPEAKEADAPKVDTGAKSDGASEKQEGTAGTESQDTAATATTGTDDVGKSGSAAADSASATGSPAAGNTSAPAAATAAEPVIPPLDLTSPAAPGAVTQEPEAAPDEPRQMTVGEERIREHMAKAVDDPEYRMQLMFRDLAASEVTEANKPGTEAAVGRLFLHDYWRTSPLSDASHDAIKPATVSLMEAFKAVLFSVRACEERTAALKHLLAARHECMQAVHG